MSRPSLQQSVEFLLDFGAVQKQSNDKLVVSELGHSLNKLPLPLELGLSLVAAVQYQCSAEVAMIACLIAEGGHKVFNQVRSEAGRQSFPPSSLKQRRAQEGDHVVYLDIFVAWSQQLGYMQQQQWCQDNGLSMTVLQRATVLHDTLLQAMQTSNIALTDVQPSFYLEGVANEQLSQAVRKSLCAGHLRQLAQLASSTDLQEGFWLTHQYTTQPCKVQLHRSSALTDCSAAKMVVYSQQSGWEGSDKDIRDVSALQPEWIAEVTAAVSFGNTDLASKFALVMDQMTKSTFETVLELVPQVGILDKKYNFLIRAF